MKKETGNEQYNVAYSTKVCLVPSFMLRFFAWVDFTRVSRNHKMMNFVAKAGKTFKYLPFSFVEYFV